MTEKEFMLAAFEAISHNIIEHEEHLNHLDNAIGDGDHGTNMARFSRIILSDLPELSAGNGDLGEILHHIGMRCITEIGGAAGPLFGKFFLQASISNIGNTSMDAANWVLAFEDGTMGVSLIGRSIEGEKTMLDALFPAVRAMQEKLEEGLSLPEIFLAGATAAENGVEFTKTISANKGRAAYIGQRSIGHQDPGATTVMLMLQALHKTAIEMNVE
jgi:dihydroxyacetone kinase-like protein